MPESWLRASQDPRARAALARSIRAERQRAGVAGLAPLASALLEASSALPPSQAEALAALAEEAAPGDPRPHGRLFLLALRSFRPLSAAGELGAWARAVALDPWIQAAFAARALSVLWAGALVTGLALLVAGCVSSAPLWFHDYSDAFPRKLRKTTPGVFALLAVTALWSLGVGPWLWAVVLSFCLAPYLPNRPRFALAACLGLSGVFFPAVGWLSTPVQPTGERAWTLYRVHRGDCAPNLEPALARVSLPSDAEVLQARASLARQQGRYGEAAELLAGAVGRTDGARLELGDVCFLRNALDAAVAEYQRAAAERPRDPTPWINLHLVQLRRLALPQADEALERAKLLDRDAVGVLRATESLPVAGRRDESGIPGALLGSAGSGPSWARELESALYLDGGRVSAALLGPAAALAVLWAGFRSRERRSRRCPSCGGTVCPRCSRRVKESELCAACWSLRADRRTDAGQREKQERAVERWHEGAERRRRVGSVLFPGWHECFWGRTSVSAVAVAGLWSLSGGALLLGLIHPASVFPWAAGGFPWVALTLFAFAHLSVLRRPARKRARR